MVFRNTLRGVACAAALMSATALHAEFSVGGAVGIGGSRDNVADADISIGKRGVDASVDALDRSGGGSVADVDATVGGGSVAGANADVLTNGNGGSTANVNATVGGRNGQTANVNATVGGRTGNAAGVGVSVGRTAPSTGGGTTGGGATGGGATAGNSGGTGAGGGAATPAPSASDGGMRVVGRDLIGSDGQRLGTITRASAEMVCSKPAMARQAPQVCLKLRTTPTLTDEGLVVNVTRDRYMGLFQ